MMPSCVHRLLIFSLIFLIFIQLSLFLYDNFAYVKLDLINFKVEAKTDFQTEKLYHDCAVFLFVFSYSCLEITIVSACYRIGTLVFALLDLVVLVDLIHMAFISASVSNRIYEYIIGIQLLICLLLFVQVVRFLNKSYLTRSHGRGGQSDGVESQDLLDPCQFARILAIEASESGIGHSNMRNSLYSMRRNA